MIDHSNVRFSTMNKDVYRFPFPPYPNGWIPVAVSTEVKNGDVRPVHRFGRDLVVYRTESGIANVIDSYCPHMGAHVGFGGKVQGEDIVCPFHHWKFELSGKCSGAAGTKFTPKQSIGGYITREVNGAIFVWYDESSREPWWEIPIIPEAYSDEYRFIMGDTYEFNSHPQEAFENQPDTLHLTELHGYKIKESSWRCDDISTYLNLEIEGHEFVDGKLSTNTVEVSATGPTYNISRFTGKIKAVSTFLYAPTSAGRVYNPVMFWVHSSMDDDEATDWSRFILKLYEDDIPVWENKKYEENPKLTGADGKIVQMREWYKRWYK